MHRTFVDESIEINELFKIEGDEYNHIINSLRMRIGEQLEIIAENGGFLSEIESIQNKELYIKIIKRLEKKRESNIKIVLYQSFAKGDKMDLIIQKAVELGVYEIFPVNSKRTIVKLDKKRMLNKIKRFNFISKSSAKQARRDYIPKIHEMVDLKDICEDILFIAYENEDKVNLKESLKSINTDRIGVLIGPEGGFDEEEINFLKAKGCKIVSLGPRILRTETAAISMISMIQYELGDMGA